MAHEPRHWSGRSWYDPSTRKNFAKRRKGYLLSFVFLVTGGFVVFNLLLAAAIQGPLYVVVLSIAFVVYTRLVYYAGNETGKDEARRDPGVTDGR